MVKVVLVAPGSQVKIPIAKRAKAANNDSLLDKQFRVSELRAIVKQGKFKIVETVFCKMTLKVGVVMNAFR